jgi:hypothetical protein
VSEPRVISLLSEKDTPDFRDLRAGEKHSDTRLGAEGVTVQLDYRFLGRNFNGYTQTDWMEAQDWADGSWTLLVDLWCAYSFHLAHLIADIPPEKFGITRRIGGGDPVRLEDLIADYVKHLGHHLTQIEGSAE